MTEDPFDYGELSRIDYPQVEKDGPLPPLHRGAVQEEARAGLVEIRDFITTDPFIKVLGELYDHPPGARDEFVRTVLLDEAKMRARGVEVPEGMKIQRSQLGDRRPTIFCVTTLMSDGVRKLTYTFDNESLPAHT